MTEGTCKLFNMYTWNTSSRLLYLFITHLIVLIFDCSNHNIHITDLHFINDDILLLIPVIFKDSSQVFY